MQFYSYHHSCAVIGESVFAQATRLLAEYLPMQRPLLVADANTAQAAPLHQQLNDAPLHCYETSPNASLKEAELLVAHTTQTQADCLVAIGSGTLNDLCKYAAHALHLPYAVLATAPSMNGYLSANASLLHEGHKQSFAATPPVLMLADMEILRRAPARLLASGIGDSLCRSTILRDVLLAHHLTGSPDYNEVFEALLPHEKALIDGLESLLRHSREGGNPDQLTSLDTCLPNYDKSSVDIQHILNQILDSLMQLLLISGAAMTQAGSSAPASQSEHMLAHLLESYFPNISTRFFHGEIIAVTTLTMAALQESLLQNPVLGFHEIKNSDTLSPEMSAIYQQKQASLKRHHWQWQSDSRIAQALSYTKLKQVLQLAGCPTYIMELGISESEYQALIPLARFTRDRITFLDAEGLT